MNELIVNIKRTIEVPDWVTYIATDKNGDVYGYMVEPIPRNDYWDLKAEQYDPYNNDIFLYQQDPPKNWKDELYTWS